MTEALNVFIAKTTKGFIGYVRVKQGRVLRFTPAFPEAEMARKEAEKLKDILTKYPQWWYEHD